MAWARPPLFTAQKWREFVKPGVTLGFCGLDTCRLQGFPWLCFCGLDWYTRCNRSSKFLTCCVNAAQKGVKTHSVPKMRDALDASGQRTLWGLFKELLTTILATLHFCMKIIQQLHSGLELMGGMIHLLCSD